MANDRMFLCHEPTKTLLFLAKYYPSTGWYAQFDPEQLRRFIEAGTPAKVDVHGGTPWTIRYEGSDDPKQGIKSYNDYSFV